MFGDDNEIDMDKENKPPNIQTPGKKLPQKLDDEISVPKSRREEHSMNGRTLSNQKQKRNRRYI